MSYEVQYRDLNAEVITSGTPDPTNGLIVSPRPENVIDYKAVIIDVDRTFVLYPTDKSALNDAEKSFVF